MKTTIESLDKQTLEGNNVERKALIPRALSKKMALILASVLTATGCGTSEESSTKKTESTAEASSSAAKVVSTAPSTSSSASKGDKVAMSNESSDVADSQEIKANCESTYARVANDGNSNLYLVYSDSDQGLKYVDLCSDNKAKFVVPVKEDAKNGAFIKSPNSNDNGKCVLIVNPSSYSTTTTPFKKASEVFKNKKYIKVEEKSINTSDAYVITANATHDCPAPAAVAANTSTPSSRPPKTATTVHPVPGTKYNTKDYDKKIAGLESRIVDLENRPTTSVAPHKHDSAYEMANSIAETQRRAAERQQAEELTRSQQK